MLNNVDYLIHNHLSTLRSRRKRLEKMLATWNWQQTSDARWVYSELEMLNFFEFLVKDLFEDGEKPSDTYGYKYFRVEDEVDDDTGSLSHDGL